MTTIYCVFVSLIAISLLATNAWAQPMDTDGDGLLDGVDNCPGVANPTQANYDFDAWGDACDNCPYLSTLDQNDTDSDGRGDDCESDFDSDGVDDGVDNCPALPNGPNAGSCYDGDPLDLGQACTSTPGCSSGVCSLAQEDVNANSLGDACEFVSGQLSLSQNQMIQASDPPVYSWAAGCGPGGASCDIDQVSPVLSSIVWPAPG